MVVTAGATVVDWVGRCVRACVCSLSFSFSRSRARSLSSRFIALFFLDKKHHGRKGESVCEKKGRKRERGGGEEKLSFHVPHLGDRGSEGVLFIFCYKCRDLTRERER